MSAKRKQIYPELTAIKGRIREKKTSYRALSHNIGCSPNTLYLALNGYGALGADVMEIIANELEIEPEDMVKYFFPRMLRNAIKSI